VRVAEIDSPSSKLATFVSPLKGAETSASTEASERPRSDSVGAKGESSHRRSETARRTHERDPAASLRKESSQSSYTRGFDRRMKSPSIKLKALFSKKTKGNESSAAEAETCLTFAAETKGGQRRREVRDEGRSDAVSNNGRD